MKNNDSKRLIIAAVVGVVFVCLILVLDYLTKGENRMLDRLVQGEVLAGIVIALPTLWTWNNAISESRENKKTIVSDNIRDTVKYYDKQLFDLISDISESKQLPFHKAEKIEYIIETYNSLLKDWNEKNNSNISLDFVQVLSAICSIEYPKDIENPNDDSVENWKYNLGTALRPTMKEVILLKKEDVFSSKEIKYFSYISFGSVGYELEKIDFKDKHFVQCTFSSNFIDLNSFKGCTFINCSISSGILSDKSKRKFGLMSNK
ncbi:hypothetical protein [Streptococcus agalactiae]|uniref:hypothetical protein n=1 Tax=Streptococcus agalactiae TaxID=1311 RepID=UPI000332E0F3|nr:hypothetical protein [Streptococcus agalactiae]CCW40770.1 hypothetical protein MSA_19140 [Streptococcus agalactiae ILRI005]